MLRSARTSASAPSTMPCFAATSAMLITAGRSSHCCSLRQQSAATMRKTSSVRPRGTNGSTPFSGSTPTISTSGSLCSCSCSRSIVDASDSGTCEDNDTSRKCFTRSSSCRVHRLIRNTAFVSAGEYFGAYSQRRGYCSSFTSTTSASTFAHADLARNGTSIGQLPEGGNSQPEQEEERTREGSRETLIAKTFDTGRSGNSDENGDSRIGSSRLPELRRGEHQQWNYRQQQLGHSYLILRGILPSACRRDLFRMFRRSDLIDPDEMVQFYHQPRPRREMLGSKPEKQSSTSASGRIHNNGSGASTKKHSFLARLNALGQDGSRRLRRVRGDGGRSWDEGSAVDNHSVDSGNGERTHLGIGLHRRWCSISNEIDIPRVFLRGGKLVPPEVPALVRATGLPTPVGGWSLKWQTPDGAQRFLDRWRELEALDLLPVIGASSPEAVLVAGNFAHRRASTVLGFNCSRSAGRTLVISGFPFVRDHNVIQALMRPFAGASDKNFVQIVSENLSPTPPDTVVALAIAASESEGRRAVWHLNDSLFRNRRLTAYLLE